MNLKECYEKGLLRRIEPSVEKAEASLRAAKKFVEKAEFNRRSGYFDIAITCSYSAMFHAARALLYRDGISERSHVCVVAYLRKNYSKILGACVNQIDVYRRMRHGAQYGLDVSYDDFEAREAVDVAKGIVKKIQGIVKGS